MTLETYDAVVVGGGPAGATAAETLARHGHKVLLLDRAGRIKPCGGAIPPRLIRDFAIPDALLVARARSARMVSPKDQQVDMPIENGFVGMVDREDFDEWLRVRAADAGTERRNATFESFSRDQDGTAILTCKTPDGPLQLRARAVIGADGANSAVARHCIPSARRQKFVFAYHEIIRSPGKNFDGGRCDVIYDGRFSPDFYSWIFPHGDTASIGTGSARKGFSLRGSIARLRTQLGLDGAETIRCEGAPIPLRPLRRWDNGRDVLLAGDAAGVVAPASGEGIYYAMESGRLAAEAVKTFCATGDARALRRARRSFMKDHGRIFLVLRIMQAVWYANDRMRERFVSICRDPDVQRLTWESYMNKRLVRRDPLAHVKIFVKDMGHLLGLVRA